MKRDAIDQACQEWARTRRQLLGFENPRKASEYIGALRCTLAAVREDAEGAGQAGARVQHWPEVYTGRAATVNRAICSRGFNPELRLVLEAHYVIRAPVHVKTKRLNMGRRSYFERLRAAKNYVEGYLAAFE